MSTFIKALQDKMNSLENKKNNLLRENHVLSLSAQKNSLLVENTRLRRMINERQYSTMFPYPDGMPNIDFTNNPIYYDQNGNQISGTIPFTNPQEFVDQAFRNPILVAPPPPVPPSDPTYQLHVQASQQILQFLQSLFALLNTLPSSSNPMFPGPLNGDSQYINNISLPQINNALNSGPGGGVNYPALIAIMQQLESQFPNNGFGGYASQIQQLYSQIYGG